MFTRRRRAWKSMLRHRNSVRPHRKPSRMQFSESDSILFCDSAGSAAQNYANNSFDRQAANKQRPGLEAWAEWQNVRVGNRGSKEQDGSDDKVWKYVAGKWQKKLKRANRGRAGKNVYYACVSVGVCLFCGEGWDQERVPCHIPVRFASSRLVSFRFRSQCRPKVRSWLLLVYLSCDAWHSLDVWATASYARRNGFLTFD